MGYSILTLWLYRVFLSYQTYLEECQVFLMRRKSERKREREREREREEKKWAVSRFDAPSRTTTNRFSTAAGYRRSYLLLLLLHLLAWFHPSVCLSLSLSLSLCLFRVSAARIIIIIIIIIIAVIIIIITVVITVPTSCPESVRSPCISNELVQAFVTSSG